MRYLGMLASLGVALNLATPPVGQAAFTAIMEERFGDVVVTAGGTLDTTALVRLPDASVQGQIIPSGATIIIAQPTGAGAEAYAGVTTRPANFGAGPFILASSAAGPAVGVSGDGVLWVPLGNEPDDFVVSTMTFTGADLASLGIEPGTFVWSWGDAAAGDFDSFALVVLDPSAVPAPPALAGFALALAGVLAARRFG